MDYGLSTLVPVIVVIILSLFTKRILEPLIIGTFIAYMIVDQLGFATG